jgi:hypothetical protein
MKGSSPKKAIGEVEGLFGKSRTEFGGNFI